MLEGRTIPMWYYLQWHAFRHLRHYQVAAKTSKITVTLLNHCPAPTTFFGTLGVPSSKLLEISYWIWAEVDKTWELQSIYYGITMHVHMLYTTFHVPRIPRMTVNLPPCAQKCWYKNSKNVFSTLTVHRSLVHQHKLEQIFPEEVILINRLQIIHVLVVQV